ncbi:TPA: hypothetical protein ACHWWS_001025 [Escherichia coli]
MAGTNDFKAFATDANANVTSQEEWETLTALKKGFSSGKASSAQVSKALRQPSTMAAVLGQFIANAELDALDDGDVDGLVAKLATAITTNLGLGEARYVIQRGANANGAWIRWSDGAIEVFGTGGSNDNGLAKVVYPIALPKLSRFISIAERIRTDYESTPNNVHVSMIVDDQVTNTGFYARCQMYDGRPSSNAFSWRVYCAPV